MFNDSGNKLKDVAQIFFWLVAITCVILAFTLGITTEHVYGYYSSYDETHLNGLFFLFLFGGPIIAYIDALILYAFGEQVERTVSIDDQLTMLLEGKGTTAPQSIVTPTSAPEMPAAPIAGTPKASTFAGTCELCGKTGTVRNAEVTIDGEKRFCKVCNECFGQYGK